ncbi:MAG: HD domain protein, partial [Oscillospiraceae bacterium]|nr:HD domain protein [Oscillospiraceae bacterium]
MRGKKNYKIAMFITGCILLNFIGKLLSDLLALPLWLDSIGTVFTAYVFGPACGAVVGATVNILYSMRNPTAIFYGLTNISVGIAVGVSARKGLLKTNFGIMTTAFLVAVLSAVISTPLNYLLAEGSTGNVWGDGVIWVMRELGINNIISHIAGEFYLDFLDKIATMLLLVLTRKVFWIVKQGGKKKTNSKIGLLSSLLIALQFSSFLLPVSSAQAAESSDRRNALSYDFHGYVQTVYDGKDGLLGGMANDIVQTKDGVLWIGTDGGLYRYSGNTFQWMNQFESVKTVNCLFTDEAGRLWIGTDENGLSICIGQDVSNVVNRANGLPSDSVHCVTENTDGFYYVGTEDCMVIIDLSVGLSVYDTIPEIVHAVSAGANQNGTVAAVTEDGTLYLVQGTEVIAQKTPENAQYSCCAFAKNGKLYVGTLSNTVEVYQITDGRLERDSILSCGELSEIHSLNFSEEDVLFLCADNGVGYMDSVGVIRTIETGSFDNSIDNMVIDYQGNFWFASSRLGLLRMCPSVFTKIYAEDLSEHEVNTVVKWHGCLYIGTDSGLHIGSDSFFSPVAETLTRELEDVHVKCLLVDSRDSFWVCTEGKGIFEVTKSNEIKHYDSRSGTLGDTFCTIIETRSGGVAAAGDMGITFIRNGQISSAIGQTEGLRSPVLSLYEKIDGSILAGTDGDGVAVLQDGAVSEFLTMENGLSSDVIRRIVPDSGGGLFFVT